jgi:preprotein translocase subunit SecG
MLRVILTVVQVFSSLAIIGLVLLQRGKGAEAGAGFGAGASGTVFGARGATTALSRATAVFAAIFMLNSLWLTYMGTRSAEQPKSVLDEASESAPKAPAAPAHAAPPATAPVPSTGATAPPATAPVPSTGATAPPAPAPAAPSGATK